MEENKELQAVKLQSEEIADNETKETGVKYTDSGLNEKILRALAEIGFSDMTPIQAQAIPVMKEGKDVIGQAQTGTGKTAAFGLPLLEMVDGNDRSLQAMVLCPTRELAIQACDEMHKFAKYMHGVRIVPVYGGQEIYKQIKALKGGAQIVVGTPGRVMDHMRRNTIRTDHVRTIVLDEADEMLDMGFRDDMELILSGMPAEHQTALFSATMAKEILDLSKRFQKPDAVFLKMPAKELTIDLVKQYYYEIHKQDKNEAAMRLLDYYAPKRSLIFCNTKRMVDELAEFLKGRGYSAEGLHGDLTQNQRDVVMNRFRGGTLDILIATDVAARGIDVSGVGAVINYDVPQDIEYYVHRIGRTGRAGKTGRALTLVVGRDIYKIRQIEKACRTKMERRRIPSAEEVTALKAAKIMKNAVQDVDMENLKLQKKLIEKMLETLEISPLDLAAALLKVDMGEELRDIEEVSSERPKRFGRFGGRLDRDGRGSREGRRFGRDDRDGRGSREGRRFGREDRDGRGSREGRRFGRDDRDGRGSREGRRFGREDRDGRGSREGRRFGREDRDGRGSREGRRFGSTDRDGQSRPRERKFTVGKDGQKRFI